MKGTLIGHARTKCSLTSQEGRTALMLACEKDRLPIVRLLVENDADVDITVVVAYCICF